MSLDMGRLYPALPQLTQKQVTVQLQKNYTTAEIQKAFADRPSAVCLDLECMELILANKPPL